jgi:hypothetical protein
MSLQFKREFISRVRQLRLKTGEYYVVAFQTAERFCKGGNDPEAIQKLCRIIKACDHGLLFADVESLASSSLMNPFLSRSYLSNMGHN